MGNSFELSLKSNIFNGQLSQVEIKDVNYRDKNVPKF